MSFKKKFLLVIPLILAIFADKTYANEEEVLDKTDVQVFNDEQQQYLDWVEEVLEILLTSDPVCQCDGKGTCACCLKKTIHFPLIKYNITLIGCANFTVLPKKMELVVKIGINDYVIFNRTVPIKKEVEYCGKLHKFKHVEVCMNFHNTTITKDHVFHTCIAIKACWNEPHWCTSYWTFKCIDIPFSLSEEEEYDAIPVLK